MEINAVTRLKQLHPIPFDEKLKIKEAGRPLPRVDFEERDSAGKTHV